MFEFKVLTVNLASGKVFLNLSLTLYTASTATVNHSPKVAAEFLAGFRKVAIQRLRYFSKHLAAYILLLCGRFLECYAAASGDLLLYILYLFDLFLTSESIFSIQ